MRCLTFYPARIAIAVVVIAIAILTVPKSISAQMEGRAGLVVVHGDGRQSFAIVRFEGESIRTIDVLDRSGLEVTEVSFGALGVAVCDIDGTGCDVSTCRRRVCQGPNPDDPFWQLFIRAEDGSWLHAPLGISNESLTDGAVRALVWTGAEPEIPAYSIDEIAAKAGSLDENGVALTRYDASSEVISGADSDDASLPITGLAVVAVAAVVAVGLVVRRQTIRR